MSSSCDLSSWRNECLGKFKLHSCNQCWGFAFLFQFLLWDSGWWRTRPWHLFWAGLKPGRVFFHTAVTLVPSLGSCAYKKDKKVWLFAVTSWVSAPETTPGVSRDGHRETLSAYWFYGWVLFHVLRGSLASPDQLQLPIEVSCDNVPASTLS